MPYFGSEKHCCNCKNSKSRNIDACKICSDMYDQWILDTSPDIIDISIDSTEHSID